MNTVGAANHRSVFELPSAAFEDFDEKEWFYFGRFGCDPPATLDVFARETYDADGDGCAGPEWASGENEWSDRVAGDQLP